MHDSWAANAEDRDSWIACTRRIEGFRPDSVRYFDIDYRREQVAPDWAGPREIEDEAEVSNPFWETPGGHSIDYGIELTDASGRTWSVTWTPPGRTEGLAVHDQPMVPGVLRRDSNVAVWDMSAHDCWRSILGQTIEMVNVDFKPWDDFGAWWCGRLELRLPDASIEFLLAEADDNGTTLPSMNNVLVRFRPR